MIPIRDTISSRRYPWVVWLILISNIVLFVVELRQGAALQAFIYRHGVVPANWLVTDFSDILGWPALFATLLTSQFLHGGFLHLASNMLYLWIFADAVEDRIGRGKFLLLYLGSGLVAAVAQIISSPNSSIAIVGASGAVAGILGAYLLLFPAAKVVTLVPLGFFWKIIDVPAFIFLGLWFLLQWIQGVTAIGQVADVGGIAFWAHIGGFLSGMVGVVLLHSGHS